MRLNNLIKKFKDWINLKDISDVDKAIMMLSSLDMKLIHECYASHNSLVKLNVIFPTIKEYSNAIVFANSAFKNELVINPELYNPKMLYNVSVNQFMLDANGCYLVNSIILDSFIKNINDFLTTYEECYNEKNLNYKLDRNISLLKNMKNNLIAVVDFLYNVREGRKYEGYKKKL